MFTYGADHQNNACSHSPFLITLDSLSFIAFLSDKPYKAHCIQKRSVTLESNTLGTGERTDYKQGRASWNCTITEQDGKLNQLRYMQCVCFWELWGCPACAGGADIRVVMKTQLALLQLMRFTTKWGKGQRRKREAKMGLPYVEKRPMQNQLILNWLMLCTL